jgi:hypothetical protein
LLPPNHDGWTEATVNTESLLDVIKQIPESSYPYRQPFEFNVDAERRLTVFADRESSHVGERWVMRAHIVGPSFRIRMDGKLLLPFLRRAKGNVTFYVRDQTKVVDFYARDGYRFLQMPLKPEGVKEKANAAAPGD